MNNMYKLIYLLIVAVSIISIILIPEMNEMLQMILGAVAIIFASIFSYSIKDDLPYKRSPKDNTK